MEWDYRLCWGPVLLPGQSTTNCCCILISFSHRNSGPHPRISLFGKSLKCSLIQILYLHLEYFQSKSCHIVIEIEWSWDFLFDNSSKSAHIGSSLSFIVTKHVTLEFLISFVLGKPSKLRFTSPSLNHNLAHYNLTWSTESFSPITAYKLRFKVSKVSK